MTVLQQALCIINFNNCVLNLIVIDDMIFMLIFDLVDN